MRGERGRILVPGVHREHVIGGGEHQRAGLGIGQDHRLQHVHGLGDVGHEQAVGVAMETVEMDRGHQGVTHGVLLVQEAGVGAGLDVPPGAPLVDDQSDLLMRVVVVHDGGVASHQLLGAGGAGQGQVPLLGGELGGAALVVPGPAHRVVVQGDRLVGAGFSVAVLEVRRGAHERLGPGVVVHVRAGGDAGDLVAAVVAHIGGVLTGQRRVVLGAHVAAAAPGLVADAEVGHLPGLVAAVGASQGGHRGVVGAGEVLDPVAHLGHGAGADIAVDVGLGAQHLHQVHELVGAEGVVLDDVAPVGVDHAGTVLAGADAVPPVVVVGEAASGPAQVGDAQGAQRLDHVVADAAGVGDLGVLAHVEAAVDAAPQVLGEVAVEVAADGGAGQVQVDDHAGGAVGAAAARPGRAGGVGAGGGGAERGGQASGERAGGIGHGFSPGRRWLLVGSAGTGPAAGRGRSDRRGSVGSTRAAGAVWGKRGVWVVGDGRERD